MTSSAEHNTESRLGLEPASHAELDPFTNLPVFLKKQLELCGFCNLESVIVSPDSWINDMEQYIKDILGGVEPKLIQQYCGPFFHDVSKFKFSPGHVALLESLKKRLKTKPLNPARNSACHLKRNSSNNADATIDLTVGAPRDQEYARENEKSRPVEDFIKQEKGKIASQITKMLEDYNLSSYLPKEKTSEKTEIQQRVSQDVTIESLPLDDGREYKAIVKCIICSKKISVFYDQKFSKKTRRHRWILANFSKHLLLHQKNMNKPSGKRILDENSNKMHKVMKVASLETFLTNYKAKSNSTLDIPTDTDNHNNITSHEVQSRDYNDDNSDDNITPKKRPRNQILSSSSDSEPESRTESRAESQSEFYEYIYIQGDAEDDDQTGLASGLAELE